MELQPYVRSTFAHFPHENTEALQAILNSHFILPRPKIRVGTGKRTTSLIIEGGGELKLYVRDDEKAVDNPPGSDPSRDDFDYKSYGQEFPIDAILPDIACLLNRGEPWQLYAFTAMNSSWYAMQHCTLVNLSGRGVVTHRTTMVPAPRLPLVIEVSQGLVCGVYGEHIGPVVLVDHDTMDEQDADLQDVISLVRLEKIRSAVEDCLERNEVVHEGLL